MVPELSALIRSDHTDLDRALVAMVEPSTPNAELVSLLEAFRLALAVHVAAEVKVLDTLPTLVSPIPVMRELIAQTRGEHVSQQAAAETLSRVIPGTCAWYARALELRVLVLDHSARAELLRWTLNDHVPAKIRRELAGLYATERMRVLGTTSPILTARAACSSAYS